MDSGGWLHLVERMVRAELEQVELSWVDDDTLTLALGTRGIVLHVASGTAFMAPSLAAGTTIASRLQNRVQHFDAAAFSLDETSSVAASAAIVAHLRK
jgi:hypothetical protein